MNKAKIVILIILFTFSSYASNKTGGLLPSELGFDEKISLDQVKVYETSSYKAFLYESKNYQVVSLNGSVIGFLLNMNPLERLLEDLDQKKPIYFSVITNNGGISLYFNRFIRRLQGKDIDSLQANKPTREVTFIIRGFCASSCTNWAPLADYSIMLEGARVGLHRGFYYNFFKRKNIVRSRVKEAKVYEKLGADKDWFMNHPDIFLENNDLYYFSEDEAIESGLFDRVLHFDDLKILRPLIYHMHKLYLFN